MRKAASAILILLAFVCVGCMPMAVEGGAPPGEGGGTGMGPMSVGGQFTLDITSRDTDTPLVTVSSDTMTVGTSVFVSQYLDPEMVHEFGGSIGLNISSMDDGTTDTSTVSTDFFGFYHYNHAVSEEMKVFFGGGMGMRMLGTDSGGFTSTTIEFAIEIPIGIRYFFAENASVDIVNKVVIGFGADDDSNSTSSVGFNMAIGLSYYFGG